MNFMQSVVNDNRTTSLLHVHHLRLCLDKLGLLQGLVTIVSEGPLGALADHLNRLAVRFAVAVDLHRLRLLGLAGNLRLLCGCRLNWLLVRFQGTVKC